MLHGIGSTDTNLTVEEVKSIIESGTPPDIYHKKRVLVLTPDATRTCPLPMMIRAIREVIGEKSAKLDFMVALGTHTPLPENELMTLYGISPRQREDVFGQSDFFNHRWDHPETFACIGHLQENETADISGGLLKETVPIEINKRIFDYDLILILGPVFPHEVVGFSGGAKYLFPGISGGEFLHFFHWLGALITCSGIIGIKHTPVREVIDRAIRHISVPVHCLSTPAMFKVHGLPRQIYRPGSISFKKKNHFELFWAKPPKCMMKSGSAARYPTSWSRWLPMVGP